MNREIKFRVWDIKKSRWGSSFKLNGCRSLPYMNLAPFIIQQFTGLKDKNKKEIYEGDILKWGSDKYKIQYNDAAFEAAEICIEPEDSACFLFDINEKSKIIGNIMENPELLK